MFNLNKSNPVKTPLLDIMTGCCPYCIGENTNNNRKQNIHVSLGVTDIYLCEEHFLELRDSVNYFYDNKYQNK